MVILKKGNDYRTAMTREEAQKWVNKDWEVIKNKLGGDKLVKAKSKKKSK